MNVFPQDPARSPSAGEPTDGRTARRHRGQLSVVDAMVDLIMEGNTMPAAEDIADHADVSVASLFRYFDSLDDLSKATAVRALERYGYLFDIPNIAGGSLDVRVSEFVNTRLTCYEQFEPIARYIRLKQPLSENAGPIRAALSENRRDQLSQHFEPELSPLTPAIASDAVAALLSLTSFDSWDHFRNRSGRTTQQIRRAWKRSCIAILTAPI